MEVGTRHPALLDVNTQIVSNFSSYRGFPRCTLPTSKRIVRCQVESTDGPSQAAPPDSALSSSSPPPIVTKGSPRSSTPPASSSSSSSPSSSGVSSNERSLEAIFAFDGPGPELINGRLAMLAVVLGIGEEVRSDLSILSQLSNPEAYGIFCFLLSSLIISVASIIPLARGLSSDSRSFFVFTPEAERTNGRVAMLGITGLVGFELLTSLLPF